MLLTLQLKKSPTVAAAWSSLAEEDEQLDWLNSQTCM